MDQSHCLSHDETLLSKKLQRSRLPFLIQKEVDLYWL